MQAPVFDLNDDCGRDEPATPGKHKQEDSSNSEYSNSVQGKGSPSLTPPHKGRGLLPVALEPTRKGRREGTVQSRFVEMYTTPVKSSQRYGENDRTLTATAVNVSTPIDVPTTTTEASVATTTAMTGCESYDVMYSHHARSFCALEFSSRYLKQIDNPDKEIWETKERCDEELRTIQGKLCGTEAEAVVNELLACGLGDVTSGKFRDASKRVTQYYMKESGKGNLNASTFSKLLLSIARVNRLVEFVQSGVSPRKQSHKENDKIPAIVALPSPLRTSYTAAADQEQRELSTPLPHVQESTGKKCRTPVSSPVQLKSTPLGPNAGTQTQQPGDAQQTLVTPSSQEEHQKQQTHNFSHKKHAITVVPFTTPKRDEDDVDDGECDDKFDADDKEVAVGTLPSSFVAVDSPQVKITPIKSDERYRSPSTGRGAPGGARKVCCRICEQYIPFEDIDKHTKECSKNNSVYAQMNEIKMKIAKFCGLSSSHRSSRSPGARCIHDALRAFVDKCDLDTIDPVFVASAKESRRSVASLLSGNDGGCGGLTPAEAEEVAAILRSLDKFIMLCGNVQGITKSGRSKLSAVTIQDFEFIKSIGKGAFGNVYLSRKKTTGDVYAIKRLNKQQAVLKNQLTHIKAERNILASTDSPFLIRSYFSFQTKDNLYLVMEYAPGGDVYSLLKNLGCLDEEMARTYVAQIVLALGYLHKMNIIHRDLKPDNLLISATGHIKLTDFGLSSYGLIDDNKNGDNNNTFTERTRTRRQPDTNKGSDSDSEPEQTTIAPMVHAPPAAAMSPLRVMGTDTSNTNSVVFHNGVACSRHKRYSVVGTPDYLAPEVILGIGHDKNVDWWALGVICYEFLTGIPPFNDDSPEKIFENIMRRNIEWPKVPEDISLEAYDFINKLLSVDVSQRLGSGELDAEEVKRHPFLQDVDWESLLSEDAAVFVPQLECQTDTSYFDEDRQGSMGGVLRDISLTEKSGINISPQSFVASTPKPFSSTTSGGSSTSVQSASFATSSSFALSSPPSSSVFSPWSCSDHGDTGSASPSKEYDVFSDFGYTNVPNLQSLTLEKTKKRK